MSKRDDEARKRKEEATRRREAVGRQIAEILMHDLPITYLTNSDKRRLAAGTDIQVSVSEGYDVKLRLRTHKAAWQFHDSFSFRIWQPYQLPNGEWVLKMSPELPYDPKSFLGKPGATELTAILNGQNDYYLYCLLNERGDQVVAHYTLDLEVLRKWDHLRLETARALARRPPRYHVKRNRNPTDSSFVIIKPHELPPEAIIGKSGMQAAPQASLFG
jgi:hypothetical protein